MVAIPSKWKRWMLLDLLFAFLWVGSVSCNRSSSTQFSRPCTELKPLSLLQYLVPDRNRLPSGIEIVYDEAGGGVHAFRLHPGVRTYNFPAAFLLTKCDFFPEEFSLLITFKASKTTTRRNECVFALMAAGSSKVKVGVRLGKGRLQVDYAEKTGFRRRSRTHFRNARIFDGAWHTVVLVVTADRIGLRVDCGKRKYRRLRRRFPALIDTKEDNFHIGNCNDLKHGQFSGLIKDLILLPGSDISSLACASKSHKLPEIELPSSAMPSISEEAICIWSDTGKIAFDVHRRSLQVCFSGIWQPIMQSDNRLVTPRMDYVLWHHDIITGAPTVDVEVFRIPGEGLFLATASFDSREQLRKQQSTIFRWERNRFTLYQSLYTLGAQSWKYFQIGKQSFLAVANLGSRTDRPSKSIVYAWNKRHRRFQVHQELVTWTARDVEYFQIEGGHYLAVANHVVGPNCSLNSVVYVWNETVSQFVSFQDIETTGALDWTHFTIDGYHFLALASSCLRSAIDVNSFSDSNIYLWQDDQFIRFQAIETTGARDWEFFVIRDDYYLAVANTMGRNASDPHLTNTSVYIFNKARKVFEKYQDIPTYSAFDVEAFAIGEDHYIVVSNSHLDKDLEILGNDIGGRTAVGRRGYGKNSHLRTKSVIYRWQGMEKFVPVHHLDTLPSADWETFSADGKVFLIYANDAQSVSQILEIKMV